MPALPNGLDPDNEGIPGTGQVLAELPGWLGTYLPPQVALIHLGTNDAAQDVPRTRTIADLTSIIVVLRARNPSMTLLVAQIIPTTTRSVNSRIDALNQEIARLRALSTPQSPIVIVGRHSGYDTQTDNQADGVHPVTPGEQKMAARWDASLIPILDGLTPPQPPQGVADLGNTTCEPRSVTWTRTDPADPAFADVAVYLDGAPAGTVAKGIESFTATGPGPSTRHTIGTEMWNTAGAASTTRVDHTARTAPEAVKDTTRRLR